jgi:hypothetical protein
MELLCRGRVQLTAAQATESGRLSTAATICARVQSWQPDRDAIADWPCAFDDWARLEAALQAHFTPRLGEGLGADMPVILIFSRHAPANFEEITQTLTWPLADVRQRWVGLTLPYEGPDRDRMLALERLLDSATFWAVLAIADRSGDRIDLSPYALWGEEQMLLDFQPKPRGPETEAKSLLERLRRFAFRRPIGPAARVIPTPATDRLLEQAWNLLLRRAETGGALAQEGFSREAAVLAGTLETAGFSMLGRHLRSASDAAPDVLAQYCLRAAYFLSTTKRARARLAWMR